jgi:hypothetical protein
MKAIVVFGSRALDWPLMDYHYEDGSGYQRFFGTNVLLGEW